MWRRGAADARASVWEAWDEQRGRGMAGHNRGGSGAGFGAVTFVDHVREDGLVVRWESRHHRKHQDAQPAGSTWWAPGARGWWIGVLFAVGSVCFALGALPGYSDAVGLTADGATFFVGSLFFTTAALLQYLETANARNGPPGASPRQRWRLLTWEPDRIDWCASAVQLVGTV